MNFKDYIESGRLELYVLGQLPPQELREVEADVLKHPELAVEVSRIEVALEEFALAHGVDPNPAVLTRAMRSIGNKDPQADAPHNQVNPVADAREGAGLGLWFGLLLFALATVAAVYYYNQLQTTTSELEAMETDMVTLEEDCLEQREALRILNQRMSTIIRPETRGLVLAGTDNAPDSQAKVFYNTQLEKAYFTAAALPPPPAGKQYQLWAIDAEGPKDLGVLATDLSEEAILDVKFIADAAAFAITLEEAGGNPQPNLDALQVIGKL